MRSAMHTWRGPTNVDDALVVHTPGRRQLKTPILSRNVDHRVFYCRHTGDEWQSKPLFLSIFDPRSSIVASVCDCHLLIVVQLHQKPDMMIISSISN